MPKLLLVADGLQNGGAERQMTLLAKYIPRNWERRVWSMDDGHFCIVLQNHGIPVMVKKRSWRWDISPAFYLWHEIYAWKPDVIHSYGYMAAMAATPAAKLLGIPLVNGTIRSGKIPVFRGRIMKFMLRFANRVIANSAAGLKAFNVNADKGRVVHNGFDPERLELCKKDNAKKNNPFSVIMVGRMHPMKDYDTFFEAARIIVQKQKGFHFIAMGDGPLREKLIRINDDLVRMRMLSFPKSTSEVIPYLKKAHVGVLMTNHKVIEEGISNAIMEYMACGLPVVCSEGGGNHELVINGNTGFLVPPGDAHILADRLEWLMNHPIEAEGMGNEGRRRIEEKFSVDRMILETLAIYHEVLRA